MMIVENACLDYFQFSNMNYEYPKRSYLNFFCMVQVEPNMYLSDISFSSDGSSIRLDESETSSRSTWVISTRCQKIRRKFKKCMDLFLLEGGHVLMMMRP